MQECLYHRILMVASTSYSTSSDMCKEVKGHSKLIYILVKVHRKPSLEININIVLHKTPLMNHNSAWRIINYICLETISNYNVSNNGSTTRINIDGDGWLLGTLNTTKWIKHPHSWASMILNMTHNQEQSQGKYMLKLNLRFPMVEVG